jgi:hypothetical protein
MKSERGLGLVELIIYSMLSLLVLAIVGGMLINSLSAEGTVRDSTQASNTGQLVSHSVTQGIRNASSIQLVYPPTAGTQLLKARTVGSGSNPVWRCQAWYFGNGEVRVKTSSATIPTPVTPADVATWTLLADGVQKVPGKLVFALSGQRVDLEVEVSGNGGNAVRISTSALSRQPVPVAVESAPTCL